MCDVRRQYQVMKVLSDETEKWESTGGPIHIVSVLPSLVLDLMSQAKAQPLPRTSITRIGVLTAVKYSNQVPG